MTTLDKKQFLHDYRATKLELKQAYEYEQDELQMEIERRCPMLAETRQRRIARCKQHIGICEHAIQQLQNDLHRRILNYRYIECLIWEDIAEVMGYESVISVYRIHRKAISEIDL